MLSANPFKIDELLNDFVTPTFCSNFIEMFLCMTPYLPFPFMVQLFTPPPFKFQDDDFHRTDERLVRLPDERRSVEHEYLRASSKQYRDFGTRWVG